MTLQLVIMALLVGIALSMDALAVSLALGAAGAGKFSYRQALLAAFLFGLFQALMPTIGYGGASLCGELVQRYGRYLAALLLFYIGGKMIHDRNEKEEVKSGFLQMLILAFATSIDALLVGVSYACLGRTQVHYDFCIIGVTTFCISLAGCVVGRFFGMMCGNKCAIFGGVILILIGIKCLFA